MTWINSNNVARQKNYKSIKHVILFERTESLFLFSVHVHNEDDDLVILFVSFEQRGEEGYRSATFEALICYLVEDKGGDGRWCRRSTTHLPSPPFYQFLPRITSSPLELNLEVQSKESIHRTLVFLKKVPVASDAVGYKG